MIVNLAPQGSYNSLSKERFSLHAKYMSIECHETTTSLIYRLFAKALQKLDTLSVNGKLCRKSVLLIPFFHQLHFCPRFQLTNANLIVSCLHCWSKKFQPLITMSFISTSGGKYLVSPFLTHYLQTIKQKVYLLLENLDQ